MDWRQSPPVLPQLQRWLPILPLLTPKTLLTDDYRTLRRLTVSISPETLKKEFFTARASASDTSDLDDGENSGAGVEHVQKHLDSPADRAHIWI
jgi:hypothetical protein